MKRSKHIRVLDSRLFSERQWRFRYNAAPRLAAKHSLRRLWRQAYFGISCRMFPKVFVIAFLVLFMKPFLPVVSAAGSPEQEYQQVRTIALRDARVRAAYEDADRRLEEKIIQIDPALAPYVQRRKEGQGASASAQKAPGAHVKLGGFVKPAATKPAAPTRTHVIAKGETLGGIAEKYGVSVAALKAANHIGDEKKLSVGKVLSIPEGAKAKGKILD
jgi:LysM repeat protein